MGKKAYIHMDKNFCIWFRYKGGVFLVLSVNDLKTKEVINVSDGARLGFVSDVEIDLKSGRVTSLLVPGAYRLMGFLGRDEDIVIKWENIKKIGDDIIIIDNIN